jgi:hypothetical protein
MFAIEELDDTHGLVVAAVPDPVKVVVFPSQTERVPLIVGSAVTVREALVETVWLHVPPGLLITTS